MMSILKYLGLIMAAVFLARIISFAPYFLFAALGGGLLFLFFFFYTRPALYFLMAYLPFQLALNPAAGVDLASVRVLILLLFAAWLSKNFNAERLSRLNKNLPAWGLILILAWSFISFFSAANLDWAWRKALVFSSIFPLYFLVAGLNLQASKISRILIGSALGLAFIGLIQFSAQFLSGLVPLIKFWGEFVTPFFSGRDFGALILANPSWLVNINGQDIMRAISLFSDPHMLAFYLGLILPFSWAPLFLKNKINPILLMACLGLLTVIFLTFTRGAYLALMMSFFVMVFFSWRFLTSKKKIFLISLIALGILLLIIFGQPIIQRLISGFDLSEGSNTERLEIWQASLEIIRDNLWLGQGLGNYSLAIEPTVGYRSPITAHNLYLDIAAETGIFGLALWLILIIGAIIQLTKAINNKKQTTNRILSISLIGSLSYFSVHSFFETAIFNPIILAVLMIILGLSSKKYVFTA